MGVFPKQTQCTSVSIGTNVLINMIASSLKKHSRGHLYVKYRRACDTHLVERSRLVNVVVGINISDHILKDVRQLRNQNITIQLTSVDFSTKQD